MKKLIATTIVAAGIVLGLSACDSEANTASTNLSTASDNFEISRRIVFFNGITDKYLMTIEGKCSVNTGDSKKLEVTCKTGKDTYKKHFLGLSDNVSYFVEQVEPGKVSGDHYKVIFRPSTIVPDVEVR